MEDRVKKAISAVQNKSVAHTLMLMSQYLVDSAIFEIANYISMLEKEAL